MSEMSARALRSDERRRAVQLARHYREHENMAVGQIAQRLGRSAATIRGYLYDPDGAKARRIKASYRGTCARCGAATSGSGPAHARLTCARCNGKAGAKWSRARIEEALRAWFELYGRQATSVDLSRAYAQARAPHDSGARLRRLQQGWTGGPWPPASVVQYHYGSVLMANKAALRGGLRPRSSSVEVGHRA
jgi:hypothetical protein